MRFDVDMNSDIAELFLDVRAFLVKEIEIYCEKAREKYSQNITSYFCKEFSGGFCYLRTKDDYVHIGWFLGASIKDDYGFLYGKGKTIRGHIIKSFDEIHKKAIKSFVEQTYVLLMQKDELKKLKSKV